MRSRRPEPLERVKRGQARRKKDKKGDGSRRGPEPKPKPELKSRALRPEARGKARKGLLANRWLIPDLLVRITYSFPLSRLVFYLSRRQRRRQEDGQMSERANG